MKRTAGRFAILVACLLFFGATPSLAQGPADFAKKSDHPIVGDWQWTPRRTVSACVEVYSFRSDGTATMRSGAETLEDIYDITPAPDDNGRFKLTMTTVKDHGGQDCADREEDDTGRSSTSYVVFGPRFRSLIICEDATSNRCFGPLRRIHR
jgi:hypothetical protein